MKTKKQKIEQAICRMEHLRSQYELMKKEAKSNINVQAYRGYVDDFDTAISALHEALTRQAAEAALGVQK